MYIVEEYGSETTDLPRRRIRNMCAWAVIIHAALIGMFLGSVWILSYYELIHPIMVLSIARTWSYGDLLLHSLSTCSVQYIATGLSTVYFFALVDFTIYCYTHLLFLVKFYLAPSICAAVLARAYANYLVSHPCTYRLVLESATPPRRGGPRYAHYTCNIYCDEGNGNVHSVAYGDDDFERITHRLVTYNTLCGHVLDPTMAYYELDNHLLLDMVVPRIYEPGIDPRLRLTRIKQAANSAILTPVAETVSDSVIRRAGHTNPYEFTQIVLACHLEVLAAKSKAIQNFLLAQ